MVSATSDSIFDRISDRASEQAQGLPPDAYTTVAVWATEYAAKLRPGSSPLHLKHVCVQTNYVGSCYVERTVSPQPFVDENIVGRNVLEDPLGKYWHLAALDAVFANIIRPPDSTLVLPGASDEKALARATVVCDEVRRIAETINKDRRKVRITNVGVVGDFLEQLNSDGFRLTATDFYDVIISKRIHNVRVQNARDTIQNIRNSDIALVTGMSLANDTLDEILAEAASHGTKLVIFAETGAHFAEIFLECGADVVVAEPFPFYLSGTDSCVVRVYRK